MICFKVLCGEGGRGKGWGQAAPSPGLGKHQVPVGTALRIKARLGLCFGINVRDLLPIEAYFIHAHPLQQLVGDVGGPSRGLGSSSKRVTSPKDHEHTKALVIS